MVYISKRTPRPRYNDSIIGKLMGYLAELDFYLEHEQECTKIDAIIPDWFPMNYIQGFFIDIHKAIYNTTYQKVYNQAADKGNDINSQIMGWVDKAKSDMTAYTSRVRSELKTLLNSVNSEVSAAKSKLRQLGIDVDSLDTDVSALGSKVSDALSKVSSLNVNVRDLNNRLNNVSADLDAKIRDFKSRLTSLDSRFSTLDRKAVDLDSKIKAHTSSIDNLIVRMRNVEEQLGVEAAPKREEEKGFWDFLKL